MVKIKDYILAKYLKNNYLYKLVRTLVQNNTFANYKIPPLRKIASSYLREQLDISLLTDVFPRISLNFFATPLGEQSPTLLEAEEVPEFLV